MPDTSRTTKATGTGNIATTVSPGVAWQLEEVGLHLSAAGGANSFTITVDDGDGSAYDVVLLSEDMTLLTDFFWQPTRPLLFGATTAIVCAWTNGSGRTYGLKVKYKGM